MLKFRSPSSAPKALGLAVPELVCVELDTALGRNEPDPEIRQLIMASPGLNLGMDFLPGALPFDPAASARPDAALAAAIVWFDAYVMNVDRTARNTNLLTWHKRLWLIDHGAALYFHHADGDYLAAAARPFAPIRAHVLLPYAADLRAAGARLRPLLTDEALAEIVAAIPDTWLAGDAPGAGPDGPRERRAAYLAFLQARRDAAAAFVEEAERARASLV